MPPDNAATVAAGSAVDFPQDGVIRPSSVISRTSADSFTLGAIGVYEIRFQVSVTEAGQLMIRANGIEINKTVVGRATGTTQIIGFSLIQTTSINTIIEIINPSGNSPALTITPLAGGTHPVSAELLIYRIA
jgi:hypothetical protein